MELDVQTFRGSYCWMRWFWKCHNTKNCRQLSRPWCLCTLYMLVLSNGFYIRSEKELSRTSVERHKYFIFSLLDTKILAKAWYKVLDFCFIEKSQHLFQLPNFTRYLAYFLANNHYPSKNAMSYYSKEKINLKNPP